MFNGDRRGTIVNVAQTIRHERYTNDELPYDIALVKLEKPLKLSSKINTVCLPKQGQRIPVGTRCYITGTLCEAFNSLANLG